jgi:hypothetical protein
MGGGVGSTSSWQVGTRVLTPRITGCGRAVIDIGWRGSRGQRWRTGGDHGDRVVVDPHTAGVRLPAVRLVRAGRAGAAGAPHSRRIGQQVVAVDTPIARARRIEQVHAGRADKLVDGPARMRHVVHLRVRVHPRRLHHVDAAHRDALNAHACASTRPLPSPPCRLRAGRSGMVETSGERTCPRAFIVMPSDVHV